LEISAAGGTKISIQVMSKLDETLVSKEEWQETKEEGKYVKEACRNVQQVVRSTVKRKLRSYAGNS
jgi:hypothetical protein